MSANIDSMLYVGETPWHGLGVSYDTAPKTSREIIDGASLGWTVSAHKMNTDISQPVPGWHAIYRDDNSDILGVVKSFRPQLVQNESTFLAFEQMLGKELDVETSAALGRGETVFGCFKINETFDVLGDEVEHYFVVLNDHCKTDGKVTVLNTPVRVVCQNTLSAALSNSVYKIRIPITEDAGVNQELIGNLFHTMNTSLKILRDKAEVWSTRKVDRDMMNTFLDELFPYPDKEDIYSEKNLKMQTKRDTLMECLNKDNLSNYRGTVYQVFNALTDYSYHYFSKAEKGFDLNYRMSLLPGMGVDTPASMVNKFIKLQNKMFA